jgi:hypothetical protein
MHTHCTIQVKRHDHVCLRDDERGGRRTVAQAELVDEITDSDCNGGDQHAHERRCALEA